MELNLILAIVSAIGAILSGIFALKSYENYRYNNMPILVPSIKNNARPDLLEIEIVNNGNGIAKNIEIKTILGTDKIGFDLLPRKFNDFMKTEYEKDIPITDGNNPLFNNPDLIIAYTDMFGKKLKTSTKFKPDVMEERKRMGHIDKNLGSLKFGGYENSIESEIE